MSENNIKRDKERSKDLLRQAELHVHREVDAGEEEANEEDHHDGLDGGLQDEGGIEAFGNLAHEALIDHVGALLARVEKRLRLPVLGTSGQAETRDAVDALIILAAAREVNVQQ